MPHDILVTTHIHTDGPIPGPHSLLTLVSAAYGPGGERLAEFTVNVRELPGATLHPVAYEEWKQRATDWLSTHRANRPPAVAMTAYTEWVERLAGTPVFVTDPVDADYVFVYWYLLRFAGRWPFARTVGDAALRNRHSCKALCHLNGCRAPSMTLAGTS